MRPLKTLTLTLLLIGAVPMFGAIYMKLDGIDGDVTAAGHEKWIEINSTSMLDQGRVRISSSSLAKLDNLCQSKRPLGDVLFDVDGKRQVLQKARFAECPTSRGGVATAVLAFEPTFGGGIFVAAGDVNGDGATQANARLIGVGAAPIPIHLHSLKLNPDGTSATMSMRKTWSGPITLTTASTVGQVVLELTNGKKWTFSQVTFTYLVRNTGTTASSRPMEMLSLNYTKVVGPSAGYDER